MASSSSNTLPTAMTNTSPPNLTFHEKLEGPNYLSWTTQFLPILRSQEAMGIVDGIEPCPPKFLTDESNKETPNPAFATWQKKDQNVLNWINITLSKKGFQQGSKSCLDYIQATKECAGQLAAVGKPLPDEDLITYLTNGLNPTFNSFITTISILTRDKQFSFEDFQDELLNHEMLLKHQQVQTVDTSTFALFNQKPTDRSFAPRPRGGSFSRFSPPKYSPRNFVPRSDATAPTTRYNAVPPPARYSSQPKYSAPQSTNDSRPIFSNAPKIPCQICGKLNHLALDCFHRMDYAFQGRRPPTQLHAMVSYTNCAYEDQAMQFLLLQDILANPDIRMDYAFQGR
ncbi:uncharacterized protein LOC133852912 [Alnus glutinosa]|uniref:uncharacterized protein LOC133852912 n=1 Tax=Alnus glutinosa TaxID=3517 RepID=UPI002D799FC9|nr:uncharacterized protein LOC133852912 [Alnus glutinosa]